MTIKCLVVGCLGLSMILTASSCSNDWPREQGKPALELSLQTLNPANQEIIVNLVVTNVGKHPLVIPRVREEFLKQALTWGGWNLDINHKQDEGYVLSTRRVQRVKRKDYITLAPGEHFIAPINIASANSKYCSHTGLPDISMADDPPCPDLANIPGQCDVYVSVNLMDGQGVRNSNTISFEIAAHAASLYWPKPMVVPEGRPDGWECFCRADCNTWVEKNPCLQQSLEDRSQTALAFGLTKEEAWERAKHAARDALGGVSRPQPCICVGPQGSEHGVYYYPRR